jgi:DNA-binding transcriptional regulator YiaG
MAADPNQYRQWGDHPHHPRGAQMTSDEFAAIRRQLGLSQVELARIMGIGNGEISRIETGERKPTRLHAAFIRYIRDNLNGRGWCV